MNVLRNTARNWLLDISQLLNCHRNQLFIKMTIPSSRSLTFADPLKKLLFAVVGVGAFTLSSPSASAGTAELAALKAALNGIGVSDITAATSVQLFTAFKAVITQTKYNSTSKYGVVAGEALKAAGPNATNAGTYFATTLKTDPATQQVYAAPSPFVSLAAKTAGTGTGLNVSQIPDLTAGIIAGTGIEPMAFAITAAKGAANKPGAGAIIGGGAKRLTGDAAKTTFTNSVILDSKLKSSALDIVHYVAAQVTDAPTFAVGVANANLNYKIALTVVAGAVAGSPTNAGNIVAKFYNQPSLNANGTLTSPTGTTPSATVLSTVIKGASTLATSTAAVADIEEIAKIGYTLGREIAKPSAANMLKGEILLSKAASVVKTLATAVINKPRTDRNGFVIAKNGDANKKDELAEIAAYVLGGLVGSPELGYAAPTATAAAKLAAAKKAATTILALITNVTVVKAKIVAKVAQGPLAVDFAADVAASVAWTVKNSTLSADIKTQVQLLLTATDSKGNPTTAAKINKTAAAAIKAALDNVYAAAPVNTNRYENGNSIPGLVSDPITDIHPFS